MKNFPVIQVVLAGNPNSGKTSLFNELAGTNRKVGNFPGVTVEKVEGTVVHKNYLIKLVDLPGTYSLSSYSPEEQVARDYIVLEKPDIIIHVLDSTNPERNMLFTTQLLELERKVITAFNIYDEAEKKGIHVNHKELESLLGTPVIPVSSKTKTGINTLLDTIVRLYESSQPLPRKFHYPEYIEERILKLAEILSSDNELLKTYNPRWLAIKLIEHDENVYQILKDRAIWMKAFPYLTTITKEIESHYEEEADLVINENRNSFVKGAVRETITFSNRKKYNFSEILDLLLINRITGLPFFIISMWAVFQLVFQLGKYPTKWLEMAFSSLGDLSTQYISNEILRSVIADGIISGVGGVLSFVPNILLLFFALAILEGSGYMARAAFVVDKVMHTFGLHGKSAISLITGLGCSIPAFMSTRTLKSQRDRIVTLLIIPFMSCGAKLPVYILIIGAFFPVKYSGTVLFAVYLTGILLALISARLFKATIFKGESEPFVMELPPYRLPSPKSLFYQMWNKAEMYFRKAATTILIASVVIWLASNFPKNNILSKSIEYQISQTSENPYLKAEDKEKIINELKNKESSLQLQHSVIGQIGSFIEPFIKPLGFDWKIGISLITGFAAKELVVSSMATIYSLDQNNYESVKTLQEKLKNEYSFPAALSLLMFVLIYVPCIAATVIFHRESGKTKYTILYIIFTLFTAWILSFLVFQFSSLF